MKKKMYKVSYYAYFNEEELKKMKKWIAETENLDEDQLDEDDTLKMCFFDHLDNGEIDHSNFLIKEEEKEML